MLENEFEDEIRRKLETLRLTPSADVWNRVEEEIRTRKKRRFAFWMPVAALLLLGVGTFALWPSGDNSSTSVGHSEAGTNGTNAARAASEKQPTASIAPSENGNAQSLTEPSVAAVEPAQPAINPTSPKTTVSPIEKTVHADRSVRTANLTIREKFDNQPNTEGEKVQSDIAGTQPRKTSNIDKPVTLDTAQKQDQAIVANNNDLRPGQPNQHPVSTGVDSSLVAYENNKPKRVDSSDKVKMDLSSLLADAVPTSTRKKAPSKGLVFTAYAGGGASWPGHSFQEKHLQPDLASNTQLTAPGYAIRPSINAADLAPTALNPIAAEPGAHMAFSTGIGMQKFITRNFAISTGVGYNLVATEYQTGDFVKAENNVMMATSRAEQVHDYYKNGTSQKYINRYHFAEIPLEANFLINPNARVRFGVDAGASLQYMFALNALHFSKVDFVYYQNDALFNRTQFALNSGLNVQFNAFRGMPLKVGPVFRYHLTNNRDKGILASEHPSYLGLKMGVVFH